MRKTVTSDWFVKTPSTPRPCSIPIIPTTTTANVKKLIPVASSCNSPASTSWSAAKESTGRGSRRPSRTAVARTSARRRSAIEPKIGPLQSDPFEAQGKHRMDRCLGAGLVGDAINAVLAAAGSNLREPCPEPRRVLRRVAAALIRRLPGTMPPAHERHRPTSPVVDKAKDAVVVDTATRLSLNRPSPHRT